MWPAVAEDLNTQVFGIRIWQLVTCLRHFGLYAAQQLQDGIILFLLRTLQFLDGNVGQVVGFDTAKDFRAEFSVA